MPNLTVIRHIRSQPWGYGHHPRGSRMQQRINVDITRPLISTHFALCLVFRFDHCSTCLGTLQTPIHLSKFLARSSTLLSRSTSTATTPLKTHEARFPNLLHKVSVGTKSISNVFVQEGERFETSWCLHPRAYLEFHSDRRRLFSLRS